MYIISGRGRKSGGANALVALVRWAPLILIYIKRLISILLLLPLFFLKVNFNFD